MPDFVVPKSVHLKPEILLYTHTLWTLFRYLLESTFERFNSPLFRNEADMVPVKMNEVLLLHISKLRLFWMGIIYSIFMILFLWNKVLFFLYDMCSFLCHFMILRSSKSPSRPHWLLQPKATVQQILWGLHLAKELNPHFRGNTLVKSI